MLAFENVAKASQTRRQGLMATANAARSPRSEGQCRVKKKGHKVVKKEQGIADYLMSLPEMQELCGGKSLQKQNQFIPTTEGVTACITHPSSGTIVVGTKIMLLSKQYAGNHVTNRSIHINMMLIFCSNKSLYSSMEAALVAPGDFTNRQVHMILLAQKAILEEPAKYHMLIHIYQARIQLRIVQQEDIGSAELYMN
uniref:Uncharacterized protein n=1 Tax=Solanum lycopersicum TaxID=4081 RepID=A0A3Q7IX32_SOLLC